MPKSDPPRDKVIPKLEALRDMMPLGDELLPDESSSSDWLPVPGAEAEASEPLGTIVDKQGRSYAVTGRGDSDFYLIFVSADDERAGDARLMLRNHPNMELLEISLEEDMRNQGLGTALLSTIFEIARRHQMTTITGDVHFKDVAETPYLLKWYERNGFTVELLPPGGRVCARLRRGVDKEQ